MDKLLSVIVPALNEQAFIRKCLLSLSTQTVPRDRYEIIVSDSSSKDKTPKIAGELADSVVTCRKHSAGFGRNFGARHASSDFLAFIDADTIASPTWVEGAIEALEGNVAATGPVDSLEHEIPAKAFYRWWSVQSQLSVAIQQPIFPGFNMAVRKSAFEKVGGFSEKNFTCEDLDLSLRLKSVGRIGFSDNMLVHTSSRRPKEAGYLQYISNAWAHFLFNKSRTWQQHRKDFQ